ncbi:MAG: hypothetical protein HC890_08190 [Chloroflexaceae bacterium]|nr:hypothetical protein [Chloroflexaceae bacterium]
MGELGSYLWTLLIGLAGAAIGYGLKIPAGALVGSMLAVGIFNATERVPIPNFSPQIRLIFQLGLGILLGSKLSPDILVLFKDLWRPALLCAAIAIVSGVASALIISRFTGIEELTAFLSTAPGGMSDMSLIALDMGAKISVVMTIHLVRLISVVAIVPLLVKLLVGSGGPSP